MDRRRSRQLVFAAAVIGLALRLAFGLVYWKDKPLTHDEHEYLALGESVAAGRGFTYPPDHDTGTSPRFGRAPAYPAFLALLGVQSRATAAPVRVKVVQAVLGAIAILLIAALAYEAAGTRAAAIAAWLAAVYPPLVFISAYVLSEALYLPLILLCALLLGIAASKDMVGDEQATAREHLRRAIAAGAATGVASLLRPGTLVFLPFAVVWLAWRRQIALGVAFAIAAALVIAPWTIRNIQHYGRFVLIASEGGVTFWTGNHPLARGEGDLAANPHLKEEEVAFRRAHPGRTAEELEPLYYRAALDYIRADPGRWAVLLARKAFYTVVPVGPSYTLHSQRYLLASVVPYAMLAPLAVAGLVLVARHGRPPETLYLLAASVVLTNLIFFPQERFRLPVIDPLVIVGAAAALATAGRRA